MENESSTSSNNNNNNSSSNSNNNSNRNKNDIKAHDSNKCCCFSNSERCFGSFQHFNSTIWMKTKISSRRALRGSDELP